MANLKIQYNYSNNIYIPKLLKSIPIGMVHSTKMHFKTALFGEGTKKLRGITRSFIMSKWFDHSCFDYI